MHLRMSLSVLGAHVPSNFIRFNNFRDEHHLSHSTYSAKLLKNIKSLGKQSQSYATFLPHPIPIASYVQYDLGSLKDPLNVVLCHRVGILSSQQTQDITTRLKKHESATIDIDPETNTTSLSANNGSSNAQYATVAVG